MCVVNDCFSGCYVINFELALDWQITAYLRRINVNDKLKRTCSEIAKRGLCGRKKADYN